MKGGKRVTFVGDSIKQFLGEICKIMSNQYNISALSASNCIINTHFDAFVRSNYLLVKSKSIDYWADVIYTKSNLGETF